MPSQCHIPEGKAVFLDLDGVLADFETHLHSEGKANDDGSPKWDDLDHAWWSTMPVFRGAKKFYQDVRALAPVNYLSAPIPHADCFSGKAQWIVSNMAGARRQSRFALLDLVLCSAKDKYFLAGPGRILVDDRIKNVQQWEAAGGIGIHHKGDFTQTLQAMREALAADNKKDAAPSVPAP